jgi:hypothetical protein
MQMHLILIGLLGALGAWAVWGRVKNQTKDIPLYHGWNRLSKREVYEGVIGLLILSFLFIIGGLVS